MLPATPATAASSTAAKAKMRKWKHCWDIIAAIIILISKIIPKTS
jgi:hypothetical protein